MLQFSRSQLRKPLTFLLLWSLLLAPLQWAAAACAKNDLASNSPVTNQSSHKVHVHVADATKLNAASVSGTDQVNCNNCCGNGDTCNDSQCGFSHCTGSGAVLLHNPLILSASGDRFSAISPPIKLPILIDTTLRPPQVS